MIGVIGGNGVAATNRLCQLIEERKTRTGAFRDAHHPEMIIWQATQAPSRSMFLEGRGEDWRPDYIRIAKGLKSLGCDKLCMCCNTAHFAVEDLERESGVPFINVIREVAKACKKLGGKRIGILASDGCVKFDLYGKFFAAEYGGEEVEVEGGGGQRMAPTYELVYPDEEMQKTVTRGICNAKSTARYGEKGEAERPDKLFGSVINHLIDKGCDTVVLGCTDINACYSPMEHRKVAVVDSLVVLADAIVALG